MNQGRENHASWHAITPVRHNEGASATDHNATTGERGYHTASPTERPYMQMGRSIRREPNSSGEFGEWIEDAVLRNALPHV